MSFFDMGMFAGEYEPDAEVRIAKLVAKNIKDNYGYDYPWQYVWAQQRHETGGFDNPDSELAREHHNYAGIKVNDPENQIAVAGGTPEDNGTSYRHFNNDIDYAKYQANNLSAYAPYGLFAAKTPQEVAEALYRGGYYETNDEWPTPADAIGNYANSLTQLVKEAPFEIPNIEKALLRS